MVTYIAMPAGERRYEYSLEVKGPVLKRERFEDKIQMA